MTPLLIASHSGQHYDIGPGLPKFASEIAFLYRGVPYRRDFSNALVKRSCCREFPKIPVLVHDHRTGHGVTALVMPWRTDYLKGKAGGIDQLFRALYDGLGRPEW